jgi:hypothetical protein
MHSMRVGVGVDVVSCMSDAAQNWMDEQNARNQAQAQQAWMEERNARNQAQAQQAQAPGTGRPEAETVLGRTSGGPVFVIVAGRQTWGLMDVPSDGTNRHSITASICMHVSYLTLLAVCHHVCLCVGSTMRLALRAMNGMLPLVQGLRPWRKRIFSTMHFADLESGPESPHCNDWPESLGYY